MTVELHLSKR